jgi:hypothetical protein
LDFIFNRELMAALPQHEGIVCALREKWMIDL